MRSRLVPAIPRLLLPLLIAMPACSDSTTSPAETPVPSTMVVSGRLTTNDAAALLGSGPALSQGDGLLSGDPFVGAQAVVGNQVTISIDGQTEVETTTDADGEFSVEVPSGQATVHVGVSTTTSVSMEVPGADDEDAFVQALVFLNTEGTVAVNAEIFRDENGDGVADDDFLIQILGRLAGDPTSGQVIIRLPEPLSVGGTIDLLQRVRIWGEWNGSVFVATQIADNCGPTIDPYLVSGIVTAKSSGVFTLLGVDIHITPETRFAGQVRTFNGLRTGDNVVVQLAIGVGGRLEAVRISKPSTPSDDAVSLHGFVEAFAEGATQIRVLGIPVQVTTETLIGIRQVCEEEDPPPADDGDDGDGAGDDGGDDGGDGGGDDGGDDNGSDGDDDAPDPFLELEGLTCTAVEGDFDGQVFEASRVDASSTPSNTQVLVGQVTSIDLLGLSIGLLGLDLDLAGDVVLEGLLSLLELQVGSRVRVELRATAGGGFEISKLTLLTAGTGDEIRGGVIEGVDAAARVFVCLGVEVHVAPDVPITIGP